MAVAVDALGVGVAVAAVPELEVGVAVALGVDGVEDAGFLK